MHVSDLENKKLSNRRGTARRALLVNPRYISRGMGVIVRDIITYFQKFKEVT